VAAATGSMGGGGILMQFRHGAELRQSSGGQTEMASRGEGVRVVLLGRKSHGEGKERGVGADAFFLGKRENWGGGSGSRS
jgi:hypothetical protein